MAGDNRVPYMAAEDLLRGGRPCLAVEELYDELVRESAGQLIDPVVLRRGQDWSYLNSQVVGGEVGLRK